MTLKIHTQQLKFSPTAVPNLFLFCLVAKSEFTWSRLLSIAMEIFLLYFKKEFHYRKKQQELVDHKREICCLNNDYLLYLANTRRGKYNSSVTQHEKVNGWDPEAEFTWRKFTTVLLVRNNIVDSGQNYKRCLYQAMFNAVTKEGLVGWVPEK